MEGTLCQAPLIRPFKFGMHRQVARWETLFKGTQTGSSQLHSHQMEGTLCQAQMIWPFKFGMWYSQPASLVTSLSLAQNFHWSTSHLQMHMHCSMLRVFSLMCPQTLGGTVETWFIFRMMAGLWAQMKNCYYGYILPTTHLFAIHYGPILSSPRVMLNLIWVRWGMAQLGICAIHQLVQLVETGPCFSLSLFFFCKFLAFTPFYFTYMDQFMWGCQGFVQSTSWNDVLFVVRYSKSHSNLSSDDDHVCNSFWRLSRWWVQYAFVNVNFKTISSLHHFIMIFIESTKLCKQVFWHPGIPDAQCKTSDSFHCPYIHGLNHFLANSYQTDIY